MAVWARMSSPWRVTRACWTVGLKIRTMRLPDRFQDHADPKRNNMPRAGLDSDGDRDARSSARCATTASRSRPARAPDASRFRRLRTDGLFSIFDLDLRSTSGSVMARKKQALSDATSTRCAALLRSASSCFTPAISIPPLTNPFDGVPGSVYWLQHHG